MSDSDLISIFEDKPFAGRQCGSCTLCCTLIPVEELRKPSGKPCQFQRHGSVGKGGCRIYARRPISCRYWSCRWLFDSATAELRRPEKSHYVIDPMPDQITVTPDDAPEFHLPAIQIWVDPKFPSAHSDPALRTYLAERCKRENSVVIVRYNAKEGFILFPPHMTGAQWKEFHDTKLGPLTPLQALLEGAFS